MEQHFVSERPIDLFPISREESPSEAGSEAAFRVSTEVKSQVVFECVMIIAHLLIILVAHCAGFATHDEIILSIVFGVVMMVANQSV